MIGLCKICMLKDEERVECFCNDDSLDVADGDQVDVADGDQVEEWWECPFHGRLLPEDVYVFDPDSYDGDVPEDSYERMCMCVSCVH